MTREPEVEEGERRVLASRGIAPARPVPTAPQPKSPPSAGFVLGVIAGIVIVSVLAIVGAATIVWGVATWLRGLVP